MIPVISLHESYSFQGSSYDDHDTYGDYDYYDGHYTRYDDYDDHGNCDIITTMLSYYL